MEMNWTQVEPDDLIEPILSIGDFLKSVLTARPSVNQDDLDQYVKWTAEFGQEG